MKENRRIAYPGVPGSFSEQALLNYFTEPVEVTGVRTFFDAFRLLDDNQVKHCIVPIENSCTGGIFEVFDALHQCDFFITGETYVKVCHHLLGCKDAELHNIEHVYSHYQGFQQSIKFLNQYPHWVHVPYYNTAISAKLVADEQNPKKAAIASERAAEIYQLKVLAKSIQDVDNNYTRFIVISRQLSVQPNHDKISIIYALPHSVGTLYHSLGIFADYGINLLNLQSRPVKELPWQVYFYLDLAGNLNETNVRTALAKIEAESDFFKILGSYTASSNRGV